MFIPTYKHIHWGGGGSDCVNTPLFDSVKQTSGYCDTVIVEATHLFNTTNDRGAIFAVLTA